ncbi:putative membrane protein [Nocardioides luteus]|uniref:DUF2269 domain-containing protein n=1 Tax=Nocardioides luteus TaxID=1844 RepID=A0ABQ5SUL2_9ACTN|nr:hypothetical protein [Nocardioides luteus]MDR7309838.1 putative membrane protein [Nocardioides luteus]GGR72986.1 hypothetical protein GCM10010197_45400 [Nocardioides luteus]GLJ67253.1 hypothetical protein GCM10017579_12890 [Nocardioides luteus]
MSQKTTSGRPNRLRPGVRKAVLVVHLLGVGAWIGIDVVVGIMAAVATGTGDAADRGLALQVIGTYLGGPMLAAGVIVLATGLVLGWGTKWGLVRFWWVSVKLVLNVVLVALIVFVLQPGMAEVRTIGEVLTATGELVGDVSDLRSPPAVSLTVLTIAVVLSVYKPWGRTRRGRSAQRTGSPRQSGRSRIGRGASTSSSGSR